VAIYTLLVTTDGATLCLYDEGGLPEVGDDGPGATALERRRDEGRLWLGGIGSDGVFTVRVLVDEGPAPDFERLEVVGALDEFPCPTGRLRLRGIEDVTHGGSEGLVPVEPGHYRLKVLSDAGPGRGSLSEAVTHENLALAGALAVSFLGWLVGGAALLVLVVSGLLKAVQAATGAPEATRGAMVLPVAAGIAALGLAAARLGRRLRQGITSTQRQDTPSGRLDAPDLVVLLERRTAP
jgi:hypothetical protein